MASPAVWLEVLSWTKGLFDALEVGEDIYKAYEKHKKEPDTQAEARRVSSVFSTYSDDEVRAIEARLKGCRDRFIKQGGGKERSECFCSIFQEIMTGNGGALPIIDDDWAKNVPIRCVARKAGL